VPELVIFDRDGVLVDNEPISGRILGECLIALDFLPTVEEAVVLGLGKNRRHPDDIRLERGIDLEQARKVAELYIARRDMPMECGAKREITVSAPTNEDVAEISRASRRRLKDRGESLVRAEVVDCPELAPSITARAHWAFPELTADRPYQSTWRRQPPLTQSGWQHVLGDRQSRRHPRQKWPRS
jgi:phosphoglycolate phosphatase-like HAD superfamily hydrolase